MNFPSQQETQGAQAALNSAATSRLTGAAKEAVPTIGAYLNQILARKWLVMFLTALAAILAVFLVNQLTPIYQSKATLLLESSRQQVVSIEEIYAGGGAGREFVQTQAAFINSRDVSNRVIRELDLINDPNFDPRQRKEGGLIGYLRQFEMLEPYLPEYKQRIYKPEEVRELVLAGLRHNLTVSPVRLSQLIEIYFESPDPLVAAEVANAVADAYIKADLDARFNMQQGAQKWLANRLAALRENLETSERALQDYREKIGVVETASMGGTATTLDNTGNRLVQARIERSRAQEIYRQVRKGAPNRYSVPAVFNSPAVASARAARQSAQLKLDEISSSLGPAHPLYKSIQAELQAAIENETRQSEAVIASLAKDYQVARRTERALVSALEESRGNVQEYSRKEGQLTVLEREVETNKQLYQTFLARVKETDATSDFRTPIARVVDPAVPAFGPIKPRKSQIVLLSVVVSAILASLLAIALEQRSAVARSTSDIEEKLGVPLLAALPRLKSGDNPARQQAENPTSMFSEAIRTALTGVKLTSLDIATPVIGFTSSVPNEGKTTIALNYAIEQARTSRTLLIEADLRKPSMLQTLGLEPTKVGLGDVLQKGGAMASVEEVTRHLPNLNLTILPAGKAERNPLDLLMDGSFGKLLSELKNHYETIIIDTPPIELVSDALPIGREATGLVYIVRAGETPLPIVRRGLMRLETANVRMLGVLLNAHDFSRASKYYGEYSAYGEYGKGGYYGRS